MNNLSKCLLVFMASMLLTSLSGCARVGSERWCKNMKEKSAADWTAKEAKNFAKHCVL